MVKKHHLAMLYLVLCIPLTGLANELTTAGWLEKAMVLPQKLSIKAKLDTGAATTSINAQDPTFFQRDDEPWVRFDITNINNETITIEEKIIREATIKRHFGKQQVRPVIMLEICIGNIRKTEEVNLVDRSNLNFQLLIGRNYLENALLIDSGKTYQLELQCS